jgi:hypothetical protein
MPCPYGSGVLSEYRDISYPAGCPLRPEKCGEERPLQNRDNMHWFRKAHLHFGRAFGLSRTPKRAAIRGIEKLAKSCIYDTIPVPVWY